jgi:hypothetical protein
VCWKNACAQAPSILKAVIPNRFSGEELLFAPLTSLLYACKIVCSQTISPTALFLIPLSFRVGFSPRGICICGGELLKLYGTDWMLVTGLWLRGLPSRNYARTLSPNKCPQKTIVPQRFRSEKPAQERSLGLQI